MIGQVISISIVGVGIAAAVIGFFAPRSWLFGHLYVHGARDSRTRPIALTFDDGPNEPYTSRILDLLARYDARATFFVVGANVERFPDTVRRMLAEGHVIANHSYTHHPWGALTNRLGRELASTNDVVARVAGCRPGLARMPYGRKTPWALAAARRQGMRVVAWDVAANDPNVRNAQRIADAVVRRTRPGSIILLHDGCGATEGADRSYTVAALATILPRLQAAGYTLVTVAELLGIPAYADETSRARQW